MTSRRTFLAASAVAAAVAGVPLAAPAATPQFDRAAFEARVRQPFLHRQVFASPLVNGGAVLGFMLNSLNAYQNGFGEGPGTLHAAAVLYRTGVALALNAEAWSSFGIADIVRRSGDRVATTPRWTVAELQGRRASFFVCRNALEDMARRSGTSLDVLQAHLLPDVMVVPAGVAAINALQEERFTLFVTAT
jgi:intracellular sulfur oxidation DsrE/DsrF family protein